MELDKSRDNCCHSFGNARAFSGGSLLVCWFSTIFHGRWQARLKLSHTQQESPEGGIGDVVEELVF